MPEHKKAGDEAGVKIYLIWNDTGRLEVQIPSRQNCFADDRDIKTVWPRSGTFGC